MATRTNWKELYTDLQPQAADALRAARIKPEKLTKMADGEILAIEDISDQALEEIRTKFPAGLAEKEATPKKKTTKKEAKTTKPEETATPTDKPEPAKPKAAKKQHSHRYQAALKLVDKNKLYPLAEAVDLLSRLVSTRKLKTVELHVNALKMDGLRGEVKLPHSTGKTQTIEIFSDDTITKLNEGTVNFDVLIATPKDMAKLAKFARILGPRGLMPNPKSGTITDNPQKRADELSKGATLTYKSEPKFPIVHLNLGPASQDIQHLKDNLAAILKDIGIGKIKTAFLSSTHTPSIKLDLTLLQKKAGS